MGYYNVNECNAGGACEGRNLKNFLDQENTEETQQIALLFLSRFQTQECWQLQTNECWEQDNGQPWLI